MGSSGSVGLSSEVSGGHGRVYLGFGDVGSFVGPRVHDRFHGAIINELLCGGSNGFCQGSIVLRNNRCLRCPVHNGADGVEAPLGLVDGVGDYRRVCHHDVGFSSYDCRGRVCLVFVALDGQLFAASAVGRFFGDDFFVQGPCLHSYGVPA